MDELMQGDVLERTQALDRLLSEVHPHYFNHPKNQYFIVLTQSCDLVLRSPHRTCKAAYISIAPVRTLDIVIERFMRQTNTAKVKADLPVAGDKIKTKITEFLQRLFNNNAPEYFYLDARETPLGADCAAFLHLSIAVKADLHYQTCLEAKVLQLDQTFQAKLGWLVGQLYSRVGTTDWPQDKLTTKIRQVLNDAAIWVEEGKIAFLEEEYRKLSETDSDAIMTQEQISKAIKKAPTRKKRVIEQAEKIIAKTLGAGREKEATELAGQLEKDTILTSLLNK